MEKFLEVDVKVEKSPSKGNVYNVYMSVVKQTYRGDKFFVNTAGRYKTDFVSRFEVRLVSASMPQINSYPTVYVGGSQKGLDNNGASFIDVTFELAMRIRNNILKAVDAYNKTMEVNLKKKKETEKV